MNDNLVTINLNSVIDMKNYDNQIRGTQERKD